MTETFARRHEQIWRRFDKSWFVDFNPTSLGDKLRHDSTTEILSRRNLLGAFGAASGLALLNHAVAQENNPAAQVADSGSSIRITAMKTHRVQHKVDYTAESPLAPNKK